MGTTAGAAAGTSNTGSVQLIAPDAQLPWDPATETQLRAVLTDPATAPAEIAAALDRSERSIRRDWQKARLFLLSALQGE